MKRIKLLPCPFCGSKAKMIKTGRNEYLVECTKIGNCYGKQNADLGYTYESDSANLWNMRLIPAMDTERDFLAMKLHVAECFIPCNCDWDRKLPWSAHSSQCPKRVYHNTISTIGKIHKREPKP